MTSSESAIKLSSAIVNIRKGEARAYKAGGAWIYDNEITSIEGTYSNGDVVAVHDFDGYPLGYGVINDNSKIRVRMLSRNGKISITEAINEEFFLSRVKAAWDYRKVVLKGDSDSMNSCRIIFGEADNLPGLVIDKYSDILVVECLSLGMDRLKMMIIHQLIDCMDADGYTIRAVFERSDAAVRKKEGMTPYKGLLYHRDGIDNASFSPLVEIIENGVKYTVDVENGQKTGFFLDQKFNRKAMQGIVEGYVKNALLKNSAEPIRILDCFTHMGTFALNCGLAASHTLATSNTAGNSQTIDINVTGLDISEFAVSQATSNAKLNGLSDIVTFRTANVLDELPKLYSEGEQYDILILDPPAFTKSREATKNAIKGYREINMKGMKLVKNGGYFATCSCSHFMTQDLFTETIAQAAKAVHKRLRQIEFRTQSSDHPILWAADESYYLKFYIFQVTND